MPITEKQKHTLRGTGHSLKPVVIIGNAGLSDTVAIEIEQALAYHELIKVRVNALDRVARQQIIEEICTKSSATLVQQIGHIALLFRQKTEKSRFDLTEQKKDKAKKT